MTDAAALSREGGGMTETIMSCGKTYCVYCGEVVPELVEWDEYTKYSFYNCTCEKALIEIECKQKMPQADRKIVNRLRYEDELRQLKDKYGMK
jgi:predicted YcjX-like family ATPase